MPIGTRPGKEARKRTAEEKKKARGEAYPIADAVEEVFVPCSSLRYKKQATLEGEFEGFIGAHRVLFGFAFPAAGATETSLSLSLSCF